MSRSRGCVKQVSFELCKQRLRRSLDSCCLWLGSAQGGQVCLLYVDSPGVLNHLSFVMCYKPVPLCLAEAAHGEGLSRETGSGCKSSVSRMDMAELTTLEANSSS